MKQAIIIIFLLFPALMDTHGQEFESFDREKWREITRDINYSSGQDDKQNSPNDKSSGDGSERGELNDDDGGGFSSSWSGVLFPSLGPVFQIILIVIFIVILVFIISKLVGGNINLNVKKKTKPNNDEATLEKLEENLLESDLMRWLKKAVEDKNYRLALRIYYLMIIKELSILNIIKWKKEKTNLEYLYEMRDHNSHSAFVEITDIYQLVWYGEKDYDDQYLIKASHKFKQYFHSLSPAGNG